jgi:hypothetical protein
MPRIYQNGGVPAAPVFNFLRTAKPLFCGNLRQKYDSYTKKGVATVKVTPFGEDGKDRPVRVVIIQVRDLAGRVPKGKGE